MPDKITWLKFYLRNFFTDKILLDVYNTFKNISVYSNLIINTTPNVDVLKSIVSTLLLSAADAVDYNAYSFNQLVMSYVKDADELAVMNFKDINHIVSENDVLILYDLFSPSNVRLSELINYVVGNRLMSFKYTIVVFTERKYTDYIDAELLKKFTIINYVCSTVVSSIRSDSIY